ncbi:pilus assembly protein CpaB [Agromyces sp. 3263]|uniref:Flp pilus assembly protein CpaB n=1 Tax=Agromyces sp. 3263 TaxID=2817750 RepID=UPI0028545FBD|nr:Flp pilus assembly protein CpaB [Agromyces sp. 3263]MDR6905396.1 pilus assembly protein CpaB [Agromyces sp. 3263]
MIRIIGAIVAIILAAAGAAALFFYVQGADIRAAQGAEFTDVYVVSETVPLGTPGEDIKQYVKVEDLPAISIQDGIVTNLADLEGLASNAILIPGEQLLEARFSDPEQLAANGEVVLPEGMQEITIALSVERVVGGAVTPGSTVGVIYTSNTFERASTTQTTDTQFMYHRMLVTRVVPGTTLVSDESDSDASEVSAFMVTLAVTAPQAEKLAYGAEQQSDGYGGLWLTLEPETADQSGSTRRTGENILE